MRKVHYKGFHFATKLGVTPQCMRGSNTVAEQKRTARPRTDDQLQDKKNNVH